MGDFSEALRRAGVDRGEGAPSEEPWETHQDQEEAPRDAKSHLLDVSLDAPAGPPKRPARGFFDPAPETAGERTPSADEAAHKDATEEAEPEGIQIEIPRSKEGFWKARVVLVDHSPEAERYRHFALRVQRELDSRHARSVLVTSALRDEGKTVTACNLALALASIAAGRRIALVDLDLRSPSVFSAMEIVPRVGIEHVLSRRAPLSAACVRTDLPSLDFFPAADPVSHAHELLASSILGNLLCELENRYDIVICDTPPVLPVPDVPLILPHVGACVIVARAGKTHQAPFREMLDLLPQRQLIGTFLNEEHSSRHAKRYGYGAGSGEGSNPQRDEVVG